MKKTVSEEIKNLLLRTVRKKLKLYKPETLYMPFHHRLLGKDRYAMFSFIQSMNTTFGMSIWEQIAAILSNSAGDRAERQYKLLGQIDHKTETVISRMHHSLRKGEIEPNNNNEIKEIKNNIVHGNPEKDPDSQVDLFIKKSSKEFYFDIISAKPNMKEFSVLKLKLLRWIALRLSQNKEVNVYSRLAIPYNPYHPESYERWTLKGLYDLKNWEILVGEEFWNFVGNEKLYDDLLDVFEDAGKILRKEIDIKFQEFKRFRGRSSNH